MAAGSQRCAMSRRDLKINAYFVTFFPLPKLQNFSKKCGMLQCCLEESKRLVEIPPQAHSALMP